MERWKSLSKVNDLHNDTLLERKRERDKERERERKRERERDPTKANIETNPAIKQSELTWYDLLIIGSRDFYLMSFLSLGAFQVQILVTCFKVKLHCDKRNYRK